MGRSAGPGPGCNATTLTRPPGPRDTFQGPCGKRGGCPPLSTCLGTRREAWPEQPRHSGDSHGVACRAPGATGMTFV